MKNKLLILLFCLLTTITVNSQHSDNDPTTPCNQANTCVGTFWGSVANAQTDYQKDLFSASDDFGSCALDAFDANFLDSESSSYGSFWGGLEFLMGIGSVIGAELNLMQTMENCLNDLYAACEAVDNKFIDDLMTAEHHKDDCLNAAGCDVHPDYYTPLPPHPPGGDW